jgi:excinuclease UvrABC ATPase subunit
MPLEFFVDEKTVIISKLQPLEDVGLGYLKVGPECNDTFSGWGSSAGETGEVPVKNEYRPHPLLL